MTVLDSSGHTGFPSVGTQKIVTVKITPEQQEQGLVWKWKI